MHMYIHSRIHIYIHTYEYIHMYIHSFTDDWNLSLTKQCLSNSMQGHLIFFYYVWFILFFRNAGQDPHKWFPNPLLGFIFHSKKHCCEHIEEEIKALAIHIWETWMQSLHFCFCLFCISSMCSDDSNKGLGLHFEIICCSYYKD